MREGPAAANIAGVMGAGGLGDHTKTLGPLVKAGGLSALSGIGNAFTDKKSRGNLKTVMKDGGLSGDHPDTLAEVFVKGLKGSGQNLKEYAEAFALVPEESKMMLDAFNEYPDDAREPGELVAKLLGKFNGDVDKLQTTFTSKIKTVTASRRNQAIRFAPHFDGKDFKDNWKGETAAMKTTGVKTVTCSILKRHTPTYFNKDNMGQAGVHSQFPPGTDVGALIEEALQSFGNNPLPQNKVKLNVGGDPPFLVEIGFLNPQMCNHFTPWTGGLSHQEVQRGLRRPPAPPHPKETPGFETADINTILEAIK